MKIRSIQVRMMFLRSFLLSRRIQRPCLAFLAACLAGALTGRLAAAEDWVRLDFRNRIPGVLDAPVYDFDGSRLVGLQTYTQVAAMLYASPEGPYALAPVAGPRAFGTGPNAGYWEPFDPAVSAAVTLPGVTLGKEFFFEIRVIELRSGVGPNDVLAGRSPLYRVVATNTIMTLAGLESFRLEPEKLHIRLEGDQVVIEWSYWGARHYSLEAAKSLEPSAQWYPVFSRSNYGYAGEVISVTNAVTDSPEFYRLWRTR